MTYGESLKKLWTDKYKIHSFDVNTKGHAGIPSICRFMQETAYNHAEHLGVGYSFLKTINLVWILSSQKVRMQRFPVWGEEITIQTWPSSKDRLFYYRDFRILDSNQTQIGIASTRWLLLDSGSKRPQRPDSHFEFEIKHDEKVFEDGFEKIDIPDECDFKKPKLVEYSDTDIYEHVNNTKYIEYLIDSIPAEYRESGELSEIQIDYVNETLEGEGLTIENTMIDDNIYLHHILLDRKRKTVCRAKTMWTQSEKFS